MCYFLNSHSKNDNGNYKYKMHHCRSIKIFEQLVIL